MQLDEFIKEVTTQIVSGIRAAQATEQGGFVVASGDGGHNYANHSRISSSGRLKSTIVDFDIALTVEDSSKGGGSGGVKVMGFHMGASGEAATKDTTVSRIQFAIPLLLPESQRNWFEDLKKSQP